MVGDAAAANRSVTSGPVTPNPLAAPAVATPTTPAQPAPVAVSHQTGLASWYGPGFAGRRTANGEVFDPSDLTAAHRELPFNTLVRVTNDETGASVVVRINDRGPFRSGRIIDLSRAAAEEIGMVGKGVGHVSLQVVTLPENAVRIEPSTELRGFEVISRFHPVGTLLVLTPIEGGDPMVVRVVSSEAPIDSPADILVGPTLFASVGAEAWMNSD